MKGIKITTTSGTLPGLKFAGAVYVLGLTFQATFWRKKLTVNLGTKLLG